MRAEYCFAARKWSRNWVRTFWSANMCVQPSRDAIRGNEQQTNRKKCDDQTEAHHKAVALQEAKREDGDRGTWQHMSERHRQGNDDSEQKADCTYRRNCPIACEPAHARTCY